MGSSVVLFGSRDWKRRTRIRETREGRQRKLAVNEEFWVLPSFSFPFQVTSIIVRVRKSREGQLCLRQAGGVPWNDKRSQKMRQTHPENIFRTPFVMEKGCPKCKIHANPATRATMTQPQRRPQHTATMSFEKPPEDSKDKPPEKHARMAEASSDGGAMPLDWTRVDRSDGKDEDHEVPVRYPWDVTDIDKQDTELVIVGTAGMKVNRMGTNLGEYCNPNLLQLILRSNLIQKMEGLSDFTQLELLELYDNMIEELQCLNEGKGGAPGSTLRVLDMSYNVIRDMSPVQVCPNLTELCTYQGWWSCDAVVTDTTVLHSCSLSFFLYLYSTDLANNKLKSMAGLKGLTSLRKIDLGANRIRIMDVDQLSGLVNLEELWIGKNKIEEICGLEKVRVSLWWSCWLHRQDYSNLTLRSLLFSSLAHKTPQTGCAVESPHQSDQSIHTSRYIGRTLSRSQWH